MNTSAHSLSGPPGLPRRSVLALLLGTALSACGGGGSPIAGVSSGGTGSFTSGSIVGFGSIIVNGVRYDDSLAKVADVDGTDHSNSNALKLGMVVAVQGSATTVAQAGFNYTAEGTASQVVFVTELLGPVTNVVRDAQGQAQSFDILGQTVHWSSTTVFDGLSTTLGAVEQGQFAEVYGFWDGEFWQASRVETSSTAPAVYRLSGVVTAIDTAAHTLTIGQETVSYAAVGLDAALGVGTSVRAVLNPNRVLAQPWAATAIRRADLQALPNVTSAELDGFEMELEGIVSGVVGSRFTLQGLTVDGSALGAPITNGQRVEVKGRFTQGVLIAQSWESDEDSDRERKGFELHGVVSALSANTFELRGYSVTYDASTKGAQVLANGIGVEVKLQLQANGSWYAREIESDENASATGSGNDDGGELEGVETSDGD